MKKQKTCNLEHELDRISNLPDPLRRHIVSFLSIEDAVKTSILSRQWRCLSCSLSNLVFNQYTFEGKNLKKVPFKDIVDHVLHYHDQSNVESFKLKVGINKQGLIQERHVNSWIAFAVRYNVHELHISIYLGRLQDLPYRLFTCDTLTVLHLASVDLRLPSTIKLPSLKTLILDRVSFFDDYLTEKLFSSCPLLERLDMTIHDLCYLSCLTISSSSLKILKMCVCFVCSIKIRIYTPNLQKISYTGRSLPNICHETLSSLCYASFQLNLPPNDLPNSLGELLTRMHNVTMLSLIGYYIEFVSKDPIFLACLPTSCCSLNHLQVEIRLTKSHFQVLMILLRSFHHLQTLHIKIRLTEAHNIEGCCIGQELIVKDLLSHLKTIKIESFGGSESEIKLLRFLLANANNLVQMNISYVYSMRENAEAQMKMSEKFLTFTKTSPHAAIVFS